MFKLCSDRTATPSSVASPRCSGGGNGRETGAVGRALKAKATYGYFDWDFATSDDAVEISGRISADRSAFVDLRYNNPPGGSKHCLNTKIATAELTLRDRRTGHIETLHAQNRALFEILTSDTDHGIELRA
jgi:hypothetical protein